MLDSLNMPDEAQPAAGQIVNGYRVMGKLGAGGMGVVYKALDVKLNRAVALKFLPGDTDTNAGTSPQAQKALLGEARAASALDHPNIGTIHGIEDTSDGRTFIVMAYYEGMTLNQRIREGPLPPTEAVSIAIQMAKGLAEAHAHDIVHRDVKPSNTIVTLQGVVKIVDFGLARIIDSNTSTQTAAIAGTAPYMSPEQADGKHIDYRTDLWSLGVVLYQMLTGHIPFSAPSTPAMLYAIVHAPAPEMDPRIPAALQKVIYQALAKEPADRYQSAAGMLKDLEEAQSAVSTAQSAPTLTARDLAQYRELATNTSLTRAERSKRRLTRLVAALVAALALPLLAIALYAPWRQRVSEALFGAAQRHIAVLPISAIGNDPEGAALADGLMESLTSRLSNLEVGNQSLWVVPASEVRRRKITDAEAARKEFGVNLVITGSVQRNGNDVRLTVNLIDAKTIRQIGSGQFEDLTGDYTVLQDSSLSKLANLMNIAVTPGMLHNTGDKVRPVAYESYLTALGYLQRYDKAGSLDQAAKLLDNAVREDPKFASAFAALGQTYLIKYKSEQDPKWLDLASANCNRAIGLNNQLAPVYATLGRVLEARGQHDLALEQFQHALTLEPRNSDALLGEALTFETLGRLKDAEEIYRRGSALRPDYWDGYMQLGNFYFRQNRFADAVAPLKRVIELTPDNAEGYSNLGVAYRRLKNYSQAIAAFETAIKLAPTYRFYSNLGNVYVDQGDYKGAAEKYRRAAELNDKDFRVWMNLANAYRHAGEQQKAMDASAKALPLVEDVASRQPQVAQNQSTLAALYARLHQREKAIPRIEATIALGPKDSNVLEQIAVAYEAIGERRLAIEWLVKSLAAGNVLAEVKLNPELRSLVSDPNFKPPTTSSLTKK